MYHDYIQGCRCQAFVCMEGAGRVVGQKTK